MYIYIYNKEGGLFGWSDIQSAVCQESPRRVVGMWSVLGGSVIFDLRGR